MQKIQVAIVEDIQIIREGLKSILDSTDGFICSGVYGTGEEAAAALGDLKPNVVLMDINLPTLDGLGATRRIRENDALRDIPIVAITAFGTEGFQRAAYDVGVSGYLTKPLDLDRMNQLIARLLSPTGSGNLSSLT